MPFDPYAADEATIEEAVPQYSMPRGTYASPDLSEGDAYIDEFGWSARLRTSAVETPSAQRLGVIPRYDLYPDPSKAPEEYYAPRDNDSRARESTTSGQTNLFQERKGIGAERRFADNPRSVPPPESRITQQLIPASYSFTRPFDQLNRTHAGDPPTGSARTFNGMHFSMADNKRSYEAVGSMPVQSRRNTYRIEPAPWDTGVVDKDGTSGNIYGQVINTYQTAPRNRALRTGG